MLETVEKSEAIREREQAIDREIADIQSKLGDDDTSERTLTPFSDIEAEDPEWLFPGYVPKNAIFSVVGDGGIGKTSLLCSLAASVSTGKRPFFLTDNDVPDWDYGAEPVLIFSSEDSPKFVLKKRLESAGADMNKVFTMEPSDPRLSEVKFGSPLIEEFYKAYKPGLVIFDPIQGFLPPNLNMSQRNAMRDCLSPLVGLGEKYGVTTCIVVHTNKQSNVWGRKRMADSSDFWDICRSVLIAGETQDEGIRYLSHEKSNYGPRQKTILFSLEDGTVHYEGTSELSDCDYVQQARYNVQQAPAREEAEQFILDTVNAAECSEMEVKELEEMATDAGITKSALKRAKTELRRNGKIRFFNRGFGDNKKHFIASKSPS